MVRDLIRVGAREWPPKTDPPRADATIGEGDASRGMGFDPAKNPLEDYTKRAVTILQKAQIPPRLIAKMTEDLITMPFQAMAPFIEGKKLVRADVLSAPHVAHRN